MRKIISVISFLMLFGTIQVSGQVIFDIDGGGSFNCDDNPFCIDIDVTNFDSITGMQFGLQWDTTVMQITSYQHFMPLFGAFNDASTDEGIIGFTWASSLSPTLSLADENVIIELCFEPNQNGATILDFVPPPVGGAIIEVSGVVNGTNQQQVQSQFNSETITVQDITNPVITCPNDTIIMSNGGPVGGIDALTASDNCALTGYAFNLTQGGSNVGGSAGDASGSTFGPGVTTVTYTATDASGNTGTCAFTVTIDNSNVSDMLEFIPVIDFNCDMDMVTADITVNNFDSIIGMQFAIRWDTSILELVPPPMNNIPEFPGYNTALEEGALLFTWAHFSLNPPSTSLADGFVIFSLKFIPKGPLTTPLLSFEDFSPAVPIVIGRPAGPLTQGVDFSFLPEILNFTDSQGPEFPNGCPAPITQNNDPGTCSARINIPVPMATDTCSGIDSITYTIGGITTLVPNGAMQVNATFPIGTSVVTYTAYDGNANSSECTFNVTINAETPSITCPSAITQTTNPGNCDASVMVPAPTVTACSVDSITYTIDGTTAVLPNGATDFTATFPIGMTTVTYTAYPEVGTPVSCTVDITINAPATSIDCPMEINQDTDTGNCSASVTVPAPTVTACSVQSITYTIDGVITLLPNGATDFTAIFETGTTEVTYTVFPGVGSPVSCSFDVNIADVEDPTVTCPNSPLMANSNLGSCDATVSIPFAANDNCGIDSVTYTINSTTVTFPNGSSSADIVFPVGTTNVVYTAHAGPRTATCNFDVVVADSRLPSLTCPNDTSVIINAGETSAVIGNLAATVTDNCDPNPLISYTATGDTNFPATPGDISDATFNAGMTIVTYTATDDAGNSTTCSFTINVNVGLEIDCEEDRTFTSDPGVCNHTVSIDGLNILSDVNDITSITYALTGDTPGFGTDSIVTESFNVGTTTVTYTVMDNMGQTAMCSFDVTVTDDELPQINCQTPDVYPNDPGVCGALVTVGLAPVSSSDNCGIDSITYTISNGLGSGTGNVPAMTFPVGQTIISYTAHDGGGNTGNCTFIVEVGDTEAPTISCPNDTTIMVATGSTMETVTLDAPTATDNCGVSDLTYTVEGVVTPITGPNVTLDFPVGATTVTATASDGVSTITCEFIVTIQEDSPQDLIDCPTDKFSCDDLVFDVDPIYLVDQNMVSIQYIRVAPDGTSDMGMGSVSGLSFGPGTWTVTYQASGLGTTDQCTFTITVDNEVPSLNNCPGNLPDAYVDENCEAIISWTEPTASDNCGIDQLVQSHTPPATFGPGMHTISYAAIDLAGNQTACSFTVTVLDTISPVVDACPPAGLTLTEIDELCAVSATWTPPTATDNCSMVTSTNTHNPGDTFYVATVVTYAFVDTSGNQSTCAFEISVDNADNDPPVIADCPTDTILYVVDVCTIPYFWEEPTVSDFCSDAFIDGSLEPGASFSVGNPETITYIAFDAQGNEANCSFTVTVQDTIKPALNCPATTIGFVTDPNECGTTVDFDMPVATDNCDGALITTCTHSSGDFFEVGTTSVICTATDNSGNTSTCIIQVIVDDMVGPSIECPEDISINLDGSLESGTPNIVQSLVPNATCDSVTLAFITPVVADNCPFAGPNQPVQTEGPASGSLVQIGETYNFKYLVTDASGLMDSCEFSITVNPLPGVVINSDPASSLCDGVDVTLSVDEISGATYTWSLPNGSTVTGSSISVSGTDPDAPGEYELLCELDNGCSSVATIELSGGNTPIFTAGAINPLCNQDLVPFFEVNPASPPIDSIQWVGPNGDIIATIATPTITNPESGEYIVTAFSGGCTASETINLQVVNLPTPEVFSDCDGTICLGESCLLIGTEYSQNVNYNWVSVDGCAGNISGDNTALVVPTTAGSCQIQYFVDINGCSSDTVTFTLFVIEDPVLEDDIVAINDETTSIDFNVINNDNILAGSDFTINALSQPANGALNNNQDGTFTYQPGSSFTSIDQFVYQVCYDCDMQELCANAIVTIESVDTSCTVPTLITPNGDAVNDELIINCLETQDFPQNEMVIYNQWGDEVFRAAPYGNGVFWDGTYNGNPLPDGTYYYIFRQQPNGVLDKGYITLLR